MSDVLRKRLRQSEDSLPSHPPTVSAGKLGPREAENTHLTLNMGTVVPTGPQRAGEHSLISGQEQKTPSLRDGGGYPRAERAAPLGKQQQTQPLRLVGTAGKLPVTAGPSHRAVGPEGNAGENLPRGRWPGVSQSQSQA